MEDTHEVERKSWAKRRNLSGDDLKKAVKDYTINAMGTAYRRGRKKCFLTVAAEWEGSMTSASHEAVLITAEVVHSKGCRFKHEVQRTLSGVILVWGTITHLRRMKINRRT